MPGEPRLYAVPLEACGFDAAKVCWGTCGQGIMGGIDVGFDGAIPCRVPAAQCPHFEKEDSEPTGSVPGGRSDTEIPVYLRRLSPEAHKIHYPLSHHMKTVRRWLRWDLRHLPWKIWRHFFPLPPACLSCGASCFEHVPLPPVDAETLLDKEHFHGDRLRVQGGEIVATVDVYSCDGKTRTGIALLESDAESLRDALDLALEEMNPRSPSEKQSETP